MELVPVIFSAAILTIARLLVSDDALFVEYLAIQNPFRMGTTAPIRRSKSLLLNNEQGMKKWNEVVKEGMKEDKWAL